MLWPAEQYICVGVGVFMSGYADIIMQSQSFQPDMRNGKEHGGKGFLVKVP